MLLLPQRVAHILTTRTIPRQTRHGLSEWRGVAHFPPSWQAGWYVCRCQSCAFWPRGWGISTSKYPACSNASFEFIFTRSIALDTIVRFTRFSPRDSHCSARGGIPAEGTLQGAKTCRISINFSDLYQNSLRKPWEFPFVSFFSPRPIY